MSRFSNISIDRLSHLARGFKSIGRKALFTSSTAVASLDNLDGFRDRSRSSNNNYKSTAAGFGLLFEERLRCREGSSGGSVV
mmetsp:Transcript_25935/g.37183  ORF Transcript_25935/g.37183 Transcript_25935/m.37183 type:complete len:82 (-) Transcript_25935:782-1027(-)